MKSKFNKTTIIAFKEKNSVKKDLSYGHFRVTSGKALAFYHVLVFKTLITSKDNIPIIDMPAQSNLIHLINRARMSYVFPLLGAIQSYLSTTKGSIRTKTP